MARLVRRPDGGRARGNQGRGHQAGVIDADSGRLDAPLAAVARRCVWGVAGADDEDRSRGALVDVGRSAARPAHRDRLLAGRYRRDCRPARAAGPSLPTHRRVDQEHRSGRQRLAPVDAGPDPAASTAMRRFSATLVVAAVLSFGGWISMAPARSAPPTVPSSGY